MLRAQSIRLGDVIRVKHGFAFSGKEFSDDLNFPTLITPGNFAVGGGFQEAKPKTFSGDFPKEYELQSGDLVITMTDLSKAGDTLGLPAVVPNGRRYLHNQRIGLVEVTESNLVDKKFLAYYLRTPLYRSHILGTASGSTVRHTSPSRIEAFNAVLPTLTEQKAIAAVLGALDDKIAANTKLARTSDELAGTLFRRALLSSTYSDKTFDDIAQVSGGGTPSTKNPEFWDGEIAWATPTDVTALVGPYLESTSRTISEAGLDACASGLYPPGSILMTSRATIGAFALAQVPTAVNQGFIVVQPNDPSLHFWIFHEMRSRVDEFISLANGATFLELSRGNFKKFKVRKAAPEVMTDFNDVAADLHSRARAALRENDVLSATRDALLPPLMSGKLRVKDAEKIVEGAV